MRPKEIVVIGSGFSGLSTATHLAAAGHSVTVLEKMRSWEVGPENSMRKVLHLIWVQVGIGCRMCLKIISEILVKTADYYDLVRLDPSYAVIFGKGETLNIPAKLNEFKAALEELEPGVSEKLDAFLEQAAFKYQRGINDLVKRPSLSLMEFVDLRLFRDVLKMDIFQSMSKHLQKYFTNEKIIRLMEFPVLFLGETAQKIPALYSLMNYADIVLGTWYPMGGMHKIIEGMVALAKEKGVVFRNKAEVVSITADNGAAKTVKLATGEEISFDFLVASADYHHVDKNLLNPKYSNYSDKYWDSRVLAPSSLLFYLGVNKRLKNLQHHNLFFDEPLEPHADAIYTNPRWPEKPLFYVSAPSVTDPSVAPEGMENLFVLIPLAPDLKDNEGLRNEYFDKVMDRLERITGQEIRSHIVYNRSYAHSDFKKIISLLREMLMV